MSETGAWAGSLARGVAAARPGARRRGRRAAGLRALFSAQALLADSADAFELAEDDRHRLSAGRAAGGDGLSPRYR